MTIQNQHQPGVFTEYGKDGWENRGESCGTNCSTGMDQGAEQTGGMISKAAEKVKGAASFIGDKAAQATHAAGAGLESMGTALHGENPPHNMFGNAKEAVAEKLEGAGHYLEEQGLAGMGRDVTGLIRQHPVPALLIGVGLGFLLSRLATRR